MKLWLDEYKQKMSATQFKLKQLEDIVGDNWAKDNDIDEGGEDVRGHA